MKHRKKGVTKYKLAEDGEGLLLCFKPKQRTFYHVHEDELTEKEKEIRDYLLSHKTKKAVWCYPNQCRGVWWSLKNHKKQEMTTV